MTLAELQLEDERCRAALLQLRAAIERENEAWRFVVTPRFTSEDYLVSDHGRVLSLPRYRTYARTGNSAVEHRKFLPGRLLRPGTQASGHQTIAIMHNREAFRTHVHRLVAWAFLGPQPPSTRVYHRDGDPSNNRLENLAYREAWRDFPTGLPGARRDGDAAYTLHLTPALRTRIERALAGEEDARAVLASLWTLFR